MQIIPSYKPVGIESSEIVNQYRKRYPGEKVMHAGALDPLAEGLLLIVVGTDTHTDILDLIEQEKTYEFTVLCGFRTDTWDVLGIPRSISLSNMDNSWIVSNAYDFLQNYVGVVRQRVPAYSNLRYRNKRLHTWAREGKSYLVPPIYRERKILNTTVDDTETFGTQVLHEQIKRKLNTVVGGFRQDVILDTWEYLFEYLPVQREYVAVSCSITCRSGTYIRSIAHALGESLGIGGLCWHIKRTCVGDYTLDSVIEGRM